MKNLAPFCHLFCSREQFFLRDKPTPTHFPQILDLSPPRAVQLGMQRGNPCSHSSWRPAQAARLGTMQGGGQIIQQVRFSYQPAFGESTPPQLWWPNSRNFQQNVPIRFIPNIMNKLLKSLCYIGSFRDRGRFLWGICLQWAFRITLDLMVKLTFLWVWGTPPSPVSINLIKRLF